MRASGGKVYEPVSSSDWSHRSCFIMIKLAILLTACVLEALNGWG